MNTPGTSRPAGGSTPRLAGDTNAGRAGTRRGGPLAQPEPRTWTIVLPAGMELLTSNDRDKHWGRPYRVGKAITDAAIVLTRAAKMPRLERVVIVAEFQPPPGRRRIVRDTHNLAPSVKCAIDGIVRAGGLIDDSDKYVAEVSYVPGDPHPGGRLLLHITETPAQENSS